MQNKRIFFVLLFFSSLALRAQNNAVILDYINNYKDLAIQEMQRTGVPASIKLAQGIHETMAGTSDLVMKSNNHFGIKCKNTWTGESVTHDDDLRGECFRKYNTAAASYRDHSDFLKNSSRYAFLFQLDPTDYRNWAYGLKKAGYATNPKYPLIIIKLVEDYHLQDYTLIAMGKMPANDSKITAAVVLEENKETTPIVPVVNTEVKNPPTIIELPKPDYPTGEFKINDTRVAFVKKGTSFLAIAQQYNVPLARIFEFNELQEKDMLENDQLIYLQRKRKTGNNEFHIVQPGETLHDIAQTEALRMESLLEYNFLDKNMQPAAGERLYLKSRSAGQPKLVLRENYTLIPGTTKN